MAEAEVSSFPTLSDADLDPDRVLKTGEVTCNGQKHAMTALNKGIRLVLTEQGKTETIVLDLPWRDVVCACARCEKNSKPTNSKPDSSPRDQADTGSFTIHHVLKHKKTANKLRCENITLHTSGGDAEDWIDIIEEKRNIGKPTRLLVIINPIGGKGQGRQVYEKQVRPLFELAGIESVVKVTEHYKHAVEIASSYDLSSVDGVVASGGDGFYAEVLQGMMTQTQQKAGVDYNNPDAALLPPPVPIALMPTGTGNGVCGWVNGDVIDPVTSALNIIRGLTTKVNVMTIHEHGKLVHYCGLRLAYGFLAQLMKKTDSLRWMKRARYPYALLASAFAKKIVLDVQVEILQAPEQQDSTTDASDGSSDRLVPKWTDLGTKQITNLMGWCAELQLSEENHMVFNPFSPHSDLILQTNTGGFHHLNFLVKMGTRKKDMLDSPHIERHRRVLGFRFRYTGERQASAGGNGEGQEEASGASPPVLERDELSRIVDVDGELMDCDVASVDCRLLPRFIPVFGIEYVPR